MINRLYRYLFPRAARAADAHRAAKLREDNRRMQAALKQWNRCDDAARWLDDNIRHLDDVPDWTTD